MHIDQPKAKRAASAHQRMRSQQQQIFSSYAQVEMMRTACRRQETDAAQLYCTQRVGANDKQWHDASVDGGSGAEANHVCRAGNEGPHTDDVAAWGRRQGDSAAARGWNAAGGSTSARLGQAWRDRVLASPTGYHAAWAHTGHLCDVHAALAVPGKHSLPRRFGSDVRVQTRGRVAVRAHGDGGPRGLRLAR